MRPVAVMTPSSATLPSIPHVNELPVQQHLHFVADTANLELLPFPERRWWHGYRRCGGVHTLRQPPDLAERLPVGILTAKRDTVSRLRPGIGPVGPRAHEKRPCGFAGQDAELDPQDEVVDATSGPCPSTGFAFCTDDTILSDDP